MSYRAKDQVEQRCEHKAHAHVPRQGDTVDIHEQLRAGAGESPAYGAACREQNALRDRTTPHDRPTSS